MIKPKTPEEWKIHFDAMPEGAKLEMDDCRHLLASLVAEMHDLVLQVLFRDDRVKNFYQISYAYDKNPEYAFDVCFRRKDGHYPSDRPLLDEYLRIALEDAQTREAKFRDALQGIWAHGESDEQSRMARKALDEI